MEGTPKLITQLSYGGGLSRAQAGADNAWEQEKLEARKMLVNAAESLTSGARVFEGLNPTYRIARKSCYSKT